MSPHQLFYIWVSLLWTYVQISIELSRMIRHSVELQSHMERTALCLGRHEETMNLKQKNKRRLFTYNILKYIFFKIC